MTLKISHLFKSELSRFRNLVFDEREAFVLLHHRVPAHRDRPDGPERQERGPQGVLANLEVDTADVDATHQDDGLVPLQRLGLLLLVGQRLLHQDHLDALLHGVFLRLLDVVALKICRHTNFQVRSDGQLLSAAKAFEPNISSKLVLTRRTIVCNIDMQLQ